MSGEQRSEGGVVAYGLDVAPRTGRRYVRTTSGVKGQPDTQVVETRTGLCCLRTACIEKQVATKCAHAEAARSYLDDLDEAATAAHTPAEQPYPGARLVTTQVRPPLEPEGGAP